MIYVHIGSSEFEKEKFIPMKNSSIGHPKGEPVETKFKHPDSLYETKRYSNRGLWASPIDSKYNWETFMSKKGFDLSGEKRFTFRLSAGAKVLDAEKGSHLIPRINQAIDYESLSKLYDAIYVSMASIESNELLFMSWDCETLLILNPDVVIQL